MSEPYMVRITQDLCVSKLLNIILMSSYFYSKVIGNLNYLWYDDCKGTAFVHDSSRKSNMKGQTLNENDIK